MIKNYFIELWTIIKNAFKFSNTTFKSHLLKIWGLILIQILALVPVLCICHNGSFMDLSIISKILFILGIIISIPAFFFMFKLVFNLASLACEKENLSNKKIIFSLLSLGFFNLLPFIVFSILFSIYEIFPQYINLLKNTFIIFTVTYYFLMSLSIASVALWQENKNFLAILKSIKHSFKQILFVVPIFSLIFIIASAILFLILWCVSFVNIYTDFLTQTAVDSIHLVANIYTPYIISGFYIALQSNILKRSNQ